MRLMNVLIPVLSLGTRSLLNPITRLVLSPRTLPIGLGGAKETSGAEVPLGGANLRTKPFTTLERGRAPR